MGRSNLLFIGSLLYLTIILPSVNLLQERLPLLFKIHCPILSLSIRILSQIKILHTGIDHSKTNILKQNPHFHSLEIFWWKIKRSISRERSLLDLIDIIWISFGIKQNAHLSSSMMSIFTSLMKFYLQDSLLNFEISNFSRKLPIYLALKQIIIEIYIKDNT